jgi:hypothetical protein
MHRIVPVVVAALGLALIAPTASGAAPSCPNPPKADADNFNRDGGDNGANVTNPYFPLNVGTTLIYKGTEGGEPVEDRFAVTGTTKSFTPPGGGTIKAREVHDQVLDKTNKVTEDTKDWFAQDDFGTVWYFGEDTKELDNGQVVSTEGSWEAFVKGANPGNFMLASPQPGDKYKQEDANNVAEDCAEILSTTASVNVKYGSFNNVVQTKEFSLLEPGIEDNKWYASGVGEVREETVKGEGKGDFLELVSIKK